MNLEEIRAKADSFFEFPTENKDHVTTTSAILFARHILEFSDCSANCHQFHDSVIECQKLTAARCAEIVESIRTEDAYISNQKGAQWYGEFAANVIRSEFNLSD